jgi:predicted PurR-regulated permease PerM
MNEVLKGQLRIVGFLTLSGGLGYLSATYIANDPMLTAIFAPVINYILYVVEQELQKKGVITAIKSKK